MCVAGAVCYFSLSVREYPDTDPPIVSVQPTYTGAAASVVETRITQVLEERLAGIAGFQTITSESEDGESFITIQFSLPLDVASAANDVQDRCSGAVDALPADALPPQLRTVDPVARPVIVIF